MSKVAVLLLAILVGCAAQPTTEQVALRSYIETQKPKAGVSVAWSEYYEGLYAREVSAGLSAENLMLVNDAIRLAKSYEAGKISKDEFDDQRRLLSVKERSIYDSRVAQYQEQKARSNAAFAAALMNAGQSMQSQAAPASKVIQPAPITTTNTVCNSFGGQVNCRSTTQ